MEVKRILFPTDFSEKTENALPFLVDMAKKTKSEIVFFNAYRIPQMITDLPYDAIEEEVKTMEKASLSNLSNIIDKVKEQYPEMDTNCVSRAGEFAAELKDVVEDYNISLIVMATKGVEGIATSIFGTHAATAIESVNCPVIVVPQQTPFSTIKNIAFASEYHESDIETIQFLADIADLFDAKLTVVNVYAENLILERLRTNEFQDIVKESVKYPMISFKYLKGDDVYATIENYVEENDVDLIAMTTHHRKLFEKLFQQSITKKMVKHGKTPLMAFHAV